MTIPKKETTNEKVVKKEVIEGLKLHVSKIGIYSNDVVKKALVEDISQLEKISGFEQ